MYIRKIAVAAGFAAGAALTLAPLASADPVEITSTVAGEQASLNALFDFDVLLAGKYGDITFASATTGPFDTVPLADAPQSAPLTPLDYELYGVNPLAAGPSSDPGSYELFNGALGKFDDAYNVMLYASLNNGAIDPNDADFIGSASSIDHAQSLATATDAYDYFYNFAIGDLSGYFQTNLSFLDIGPAPAEAASASGFDISSTLTSEANGLNSLFDADVVAANIDPDKIVHGMGVLPFDTLSSTDANSTFNDLVFGAAGPSSDPGAYDVYNGALGEFANAYNVGLSALLDPTGSFDPTDIIGTHASFLGDGTSTAIGEFLQQGFGDLLGYFLPAAASSMLP